MCPPTAEIWISMQTDTRHMLRLLHTARPALSHTFRSPSMHIVDGNKYIGCTMEILSLSYSTLYIHKSMWTPLQMSGFGYISHTLADRCKNRAQSHAISIDKHWQLNGLTEELSDFQHGTVIECQLSNKSVCQISF